MIVRCNVNDANLFKSSGLRNRLKQSIHRHGPNNDLVVGNHYTVQAIENWDGFWWLYIHSVEMNDYPYPYPSEYFEVVDNSLSADWAVKMDVVDGVIVLCRITFPDWANDDLFYEKLVDGNQSCINIYKHKRSA